MNRLQLKTPAFKASATTLALLSAFAAGHWYTQTPLVADVQAAEPRSSAMSLPDFTSLVQEEGDAVVRIRTTRTEKSAAAAPQMPQFKGNKEFEEFLKRFPTPPLPEGFGDGNPSEGMGSGFILSTDGYILTNAHVVADAAEVLVTLPDKREFKAKVIGTDRRTDVALIKVDASNLPAVKIGDPETTRVGEWVAAIGAPFGFDNTVTAGIVSAKTRSLPDSGYVPFIQTDVAVNPGNSGGPLFNMKGEVIGINSHIYSRTGGYMGVSFAIPIDVAMDIKNQLQKHGKVTRGRIGVTVQDVGKELAQSFGLPKAQGALVSAVEKGGPAEKAGLMSGDVILKVNKTDIEGSSELARLIGKITPGQEATLSVWRSGQAKDTKVVLAELPADTVAETAVGNSVTAAKLGVAVRPLKPAEQERLGQGGVVVERVEGSAARAGIRQGDVILGLNTQRVTSPEDLKRLMEKADKNVALLVERDGARIYIPVDITS